MTKSELHWVAGLLEGEGCFTKKSGTIRSGISVMCHMTDEDVLIRLQNLTDVGKVRGPYKNPGPTGSKKQYKPRWMYQVTGERAYLLMKKLLPLMGERRTNRAHELLAEYEAFEPKVYKFLHLKSGKVEETTCARRWYEKRGMQEASMYRTMNGDRASCHGWKRVA